MDTLNKPIAELSDDELAAAKGSSGEAMHWQPVHTGPKIVESSNGFPVLRAADLKEAAPVDWMIENVLPDCFLTILAGYTGCGKSLLALTLAKAIATGRDLFGQYPVRRSGPVLMIDEENPRGILRERIAAARIAEDTPIYFTSFAGLLLDDPKSFAALIATIQAVNPVQVFIDSLVRVHRARENEATEMARVMGKLREIANAGIGVCCLHHHTKGRGDLEVRARGSGDIIGGADLEFALLKRADTLELHAVKRRWAEIPPMSLKIQSKAEGPVMSYHGPVETQASKRKEQEALILGIHEPMTIAEVGVLLDDADLSLSERRLRPVLKRLAGSGRMREIVGERNTKRYVSSDVS